MIRLCKDVISSFIAEYIPNRIIAFVPSAYIRRLYYRYVLNIYMDKTVFIQMGCYIYKSRNDFYIGSNSIINRNCTLDRRGKLYIGSNVNISSDVAIYTAGHKINSATFEDFLKEVRIEDYTWIGTRATIMPGVTIKRGAVILPGAVVTHDVEPFTIVGGIPAKVYGYRTRDLNYTLNWRPFFM